MAEHDDTDDWWADTQAILIGDAEREAMQQAAVAEPEEVVDGEWFAAEPETGEIATPALPRRLHHVTAVLVSHDGAVWLPAVLTTLAAQTRAPEQAIGVDTGSTDDSSQQLVNALGEARVVQAGRDLGFGQAVAAGLERAGRPTGLAPGTVEWVWLLHDDSAPDTGCLDALLSTADDNPSAAVLGPKILGWHDRRLLLETGFSITGSGRRFTGLERREHDQGQHDGTRDVMAVSSAGMLVRRDVWDLLQGFDPELPLFRDDLDFCWRARRAGERVIVATDAVLHHREASAHGRRGGPSRVSVHPHRVDREAGAHVLLAHVAKWAGPLLAARLIIVSAVRSLAFILGKDVKAARDEIGAVLDIALHPGRLADSRHRVESTSTLPASVVADLRPRLTWQLRQALEALVGIASTSGSTIDARVSALESGPTDEDSDYLDTGGSGLLRRLFVRPGVLLFVGLLVLGLVVTRGAWLGDGILQGGALLPAPDGAGELWERYSQAWHDVGPGSYVPAAPYLMLVWLLSVVLLGKAWLAVSVLLLLVMPLAGWAAYYSLRGVVSTTGIRVLAGVAYACLPAVTGAISGGRLGTAIAAIVLPFLVRSMVRLAMPGSTWRRAAGTAILLTVLLAAAPALWLLAVVFVIAFGVWKWLRSRRDSLPAIARLAAAVTLPLLLLLQWSWWLLTHPAALLFEIGIDSPTITMPEGNALSVLLLHPGGPGTTPAWTTAGLLLAALLAFMRRDRLFGVTAAWVVGLAALALGVVQTLWVLTPPGSPVAMRAWPGPATLLLGLAVIVAAAIGVDGLRRRMSRVNFNLMQPVAAVVGVLAVLFPLLQLAFWAPDATALLTKAPQRVVPAFVAADATGPAAPRTLMLHQAADGRVQYALVNGEGPVLGDADVAPPSAVWSELDRLVAYLASGRGGAEVVDLAGYGVRYVLLAEGSTTDLISVLDGESGLRRLSTSGGEVLWRISGVTSRARVLAGADAQVVPLADGERPTDNPYLDTAIDPAGADRTLVLGVEPDGRWSAVAGDTDLAAVQPDGPQAWAQAFTVPAGADVVRVEFDGRVRTLLLRVQLIVLLVIVVLALPSRRTADPDPDEPDDLPSPPEQASAEVAS